MLTEILLPPVNNIKPNPLLEPKEHPVTAKTYIISINELSIKYILP